MKKVRDYVWVEVRLIKILLGLTKYNYLNMEKICTRKGHLRLHLFLLLLDDLIDLSLHIPGQLLIIYTFKYISTGVIKIGAINRRHPTYLLTLYTNVQQSHMDKLQKSQRSVSTLLSQNGFW